MYFSLLIKKHNSHSIVDGMPDSSGNLQASSAYGTFSKGEGKWMKNLLPELKLKDVLQADSPN